MRSKFLVTSTVCLILLGSLGSVEQEARANDDGPVVACVLALVAGPMLWVAFPIVFPSRSVEAQSIVDDWSHQEEDQGFTTWSRELRRLGYEIQGVLARGDFESFQRKSSDELRVSRERFENAVAGARQYAQPMISKGIVPFETEILDVLDYVTVDDGEWDFSLKTGQVEFRYGARGPAVVVTVDIAKVDGEYDRAFYQITGFALEGEEY